MTKGTAAGWSGTDFCVNVFKGTVCNCCILYMPVNADRLISYKSCYGQSPTVPIHCWNRSVDWTVALFILFLLLSQEPWMCTCDRRHRRGQTELCGPSAVTKATAGDKRGSTSIPHRRSRWAPHTATWPKQSKRLGLFACLFIYLFICAFSQPNLHLSIIHFYK